MRKIEKQIIDVIRYGRIQNFGTLRLSCRDAVTRDDDGNWHILFHGTDIVQISPYQSVMRINMHGFGTPTTMSRIRALLGYFAEDGFVLTRDQKHRYDEYSDWSGKYTSRGEPLLLSPCGQQAHIRDVEVLLTSDRLQYWDNQTKTWTDYPVCK